MDQIRAGTEGDRLDGMLTVASWVVLASGAVLACSVCNPNTPSTLSSVVMARTPSPFLSVQLFCKSPLMAYEFLDTLVPALIQLSNLATDPSIRLWCAYACVLAAILPSEGEWVGGLARIRGWPNLTPCPEGRYSVPWPALQSCDCEIALIRWCSATVIRFAANPRWHIPRPRLGLVHILGPVCSFRYGTTLPPIYMGSSSHPQSETKAALPLSMCLAISEAISGEMLLLCVAATPFFSCQSESASKRRPL